MCTCMMKWVVILKDSSVLWNGRLNCFCLIWWMLVMLCAVATSRDIAVREERKEFVCSSIDVRNDASHLSQLKDCTVIEGSLTIVLIDHGVWEHYKSHSYPKLVEITDYLLIFRAYGLKSLSNIFPNLAVIRGQNLFVNYALILFEVQDIEELGLPGLTSVRRGAVRLEMNSNLCYIDTIDWKRITNVKDEDNFIFENKEIDECANVCPKSCPKAEMQQNGITRTQPLCWDYKNCQIYCPENCGQRGCYTKRTQQGLEEKFCCHEHCLGGCYGATPEDCIACEHVFYQGMCQTSCPSNTYKYQQRRCITESECKQIHNPEESKWKLLDIDESHRECAKECPSGYMPSKTSPHRCDKCKGQCPKVCGGLSVDSVAAAQKLRGCTIIHGILEIQIRGGNQVGLELERSLGSIQEVTNYIRIIQSTALTSLSFLKKLRVIRGKELLNKRYAFYVLENSNLQDIWDYDTHPNLTIANPDGIVFFHQNHKLCYDKIKRFLDLTGLTDKIDDLDVSKMTNGDQVACNLQTLRLTIKKVIPSIVFLSWENFHTPDYRELLNWVVNYREAPEKNITVYNARDACGTDIWKTDDVRPIKEENVEYMAAILHDLKPYTQYAVYVKTYTVSSATRGAMSDIEYFRTLPSEPSEARDIKVMRSKTRELHIAWKPPSKPNGNVTHYIVYWQPMPLDPKKFDLRNYCEDRLQNYNKSKVVEKEPVKDETKLNKNATDCQCDDEKSADRIASEEDRLSQIEFQNKIQNSVYKLNGNPIGNTLFKRKKRNIKENDIPSGSGDGSQTRSPVLNLAPGLTNQDLSYGSANTSLYNGTESESGNIDTNEETEKPLEYNYAIVYKTETVLPDLHHFQEYSIEIIACHEYEESEDKENQINDKYCSNRAIFSARTLPDVIADSIHHENVTVNVQLNGTKVHIRWPEPVDPNGLIVTYDIEIGSGRVNAKSRIYCITHMMYKINGGFITTDLGPGNWSYRIRTTSLAGYGPWTPEKYFFIEDVATINGPWGLIIGFVVLVVFVVFIVLFGIVCYVNKKRSLPDPTALYASINPDYWGTSDVYIPDEWEVERDKIDMIHDLGQGSFGMVYEGIAKDVNGIPKQNVAVKTVTQTASIKDRIEFLNEASVMKAFNCTHVVKLLGVVSKGQPTLVVMELMANGDLKTYLRLHRPDYEGNDGHTKPPTLGSILQMAGEIADGMNYLSAKKFVHRDLAARNCMVSNGNIVKIGDFGMTRDIYETDYYRKGGKGLLPVRWMAPESLRDGVFSTQSDVWSYGVVLWEMATLAAQPYQGFANEQVLKFVVDGNIMERPENCPDRLYEMMLSCWKYTPRHRLNFNEIIEQLIPDLDESFRDVSFFFSELNQENIEATRRNREAEDEEDLAADIGVTTPLTGSPLHAAELCGNEDYVSEEDELSSAASLDHTAGIHSLQEADLDSNHSTLSYDSHNLRNSQPSSSQNQNCPLVSERPRGYPQQSTDPYSSYRSPPYRQSGDVNSGRGDPSTVENVIKNNSFSKSVTPSAPYMVRHNDNNSTQQKWSPDSNSNPPSLPHSNEGSKGSSKSGASSNGINGLANGHIPRRIVPNPQC